jgi:UDP-2,3-diacylglucosamine hydrolase
VSRWYFVADIHLQAGDQKSLQEFLDLLHFVGHQPGSRLVLLGDIFHFWVNTPGFSEDSFMPVLNALKSLSGKGIEVHYFLGNRDFLFRSESLASRIIVHQGSAILTLGDYRYLVTHGDDLLSRDWGYRYLLKPLIRARWLELIFICLPYSWQRRIADNFSSASLKRTRGRARNGDKKHSENIRWYIQKTRTDGLVHGHLHRHEKWELQVDAHRVPVISAGSWDHGPIPMWCFDEQSHEWSETDWRGK